MNFSVLCFVIDSKSVSLFYILISEDMFALITVIMISIYVLVNT